jgi:hypothetical protein
VVEGGFGSLVRVSALIELLRVDTGIPGLCSRLNTARVGRSATELLDLVVPGGVGIIEGSFESLVRDLGVIEGVSGDTDLTDSESHFETARSGGSAADLLDLVVGILVTLALGYIVGN